MSELILRNRQRARPVHLPLLGRIARVLLTELLGLESYEADVALVAAPAMATAIWGDYYNQRNRSLVLALDFKY